ncbi:MAG: PEP-CTERM sorting domain-containing protein, partial [Candidatus Brocadiaceae bacterium]
GSVPKLVISYTTPVKAASAQIWDIDANVEVYEQWDVEALNASSVVVDTDSSGPGILYSDPAALDGKPWLWSFSRAVADISFIEISYSGTKTSGIGLAFDNFSPSQSRPDVIPEPCTMALLGVGLLGMAAMKGKSRKSKTA